MACGCKGRGTQKFLWYKDEANEPRVYDSEIQAKAKVFRKGGTYIPYQPNTPIGTQIAVAESRGQ